MAEVSIDLDYNSGISRFFYLQGGFLARSALKIY